LELTKPKINGNKTWFFTSLLAALGVGPEVFNSIVDPEIIGNIPETPSWLLWGTGIAVLLSLTHKIQKLSDAVNAANKPKTPPSTL
jgi:hypothetical protein